MKLYKDKVFRASSILFVLNMLASMLNYVCQLFMARVLSVESFGTVNTIFSFLLIIGVPGTTLTMIVSKHYAELESESLSKNKADFIAELIKGVSVLAIVIFLLCVIAIVPLSHILAIDNIVVLFYTFILGALSFFQPLYSGVFSGNKRFILVGLYSLLIPIYKIVAVIVAKSALSEDLSRLYAILVVMILGTIITAVFGHWQTIKTVGKFSVIKRPKFKLNANADDFNTLVLNVCLMLYMNIDLLAVRYRGDGDESGLYSSVLLFGRIIYYFSTTLGTILLPMAATAKGNKEEQIKLLNKTMVLMLSFACICVIPINVFAEFVIQLLFGEIYLQAQYYVKYVSLISIVLSVCTILINYLVGIGKTRFATVSMVAINILIVALVIMVKSVESILLGIGIIGLIGTVLIYWISVRKGNR